MLVGAVLGIMSYRKVTSAADRLRPSNLAGSMAGGLGEGLTNLSWAIRDFAADIRDAMSDREQELREAAGLDGAEGAKSFVAPHGGAHRADGAA
jgi:hypothetical protein